MNNFNLELDFLTPYYINHIATGYCEFIMEWISQWTALSWSACDIYIKCLSGKYLFWIINKKFNWIDWMTDMHLRFAARLTSWIVVLKWSCSIRIFENIQKIFFPLRIMNRAHARVGICFPLSNILQFAFHISRFQD